MQTNVLDLLFSSVLILLLGTAVYTDIRFGKIYNKLTVPAMAIGIVLRTSEGHFRGFEDSVAGLGFVLVLYLLFASQIGLGGGDIKLMMAVGSLLGLKLAVWAVLYSAIAGGLLALIVLASRRMVIATVRRMFASLCLSMGARVPVEFSTAYKGVPFRYSPAIALGTVLAYVLRS